MKNKKKLTSISTRFDYSPMLNYTKKGKGVGRGQFFFPIFQFFPTLSTFYGPSKQTLFLLDVDHLLIVEPRQHITVFMGTTAVFLENMHNGFTSTQSHVF